MKKYFPILIALAGLSVVSCSKDRSDEEVVSRRFIHKYGYDVSKEEWESTEYPGQVITTLRDGVTVTATYEQGVLNGPTTYTYPHSQTKECTEYYDHGTLIKKINYSIRGIPQKEELYLAPTHIKTTKWFKSGTPMSVEEYRDGKLVFGEYTNERNQLMSRIEEGNGVRFIRDDREEIVAKETFDSGEACLKETYYKNGTPHLIIPLKNGMINGEKKEFAETGEPLSIETYKLDNKHGLSSYYQNGSKYLELLFVNGMREGAERHYVDGEHLVEESFWSQDARHGPSTIFYDGLAKTSWYYNNRKVAKAKFDELSQRELEIAEMNERAKPNSEYYE